MYLWHGPRAVEIVYGRRYIGSHVYANGLARRVFRSAYYLAPRTSPTLFHLRPTAKTTKTCCGVTRVENSDGFPDQTRKFMQGPSGASPDNALKDASVSLPILKQMLGYVWPKDGGWGWSDAKPRVCLALGNDLRQGDHNWSTFLFKEAVNRLTAYHEEVASSPHLGMVPHWILLPWLPHLLRGC